MYLLFIKAVSISNDKEVKEASTEEHSDFSIKVLFSADPKLNFATPVFICYNYLYLYLYGFQSQNHFCFKFESMKVIYFTLSLNVINMQK